MLLAGCWKKKISKKSNVCVCCAFWSLLSVSPDIVIKMENITINIYTQNYCRSIFNAMWSDTMKSIPDLVYRIASHCIAWTMNININIVGYCVCVCVFCYWSQSSIDITIVIVLQVIEWVRLKMKWEVWKISGYEAMMGCAKYGVNRAECVDFVRMCYG